MHFNAALKLTPQEKSVTEFLISKKEVFWEDLARFAKEPSKVKLKTIQKVVSDIKKKFREENIDCPFDCKFSSLASHDLEEIKQPEKIFFNGQQLIKIEKPKPPVETKKPHEVDFSIRKYQNQIVSKSGIYNLSDEDFQIFEYFYNNPEKIIPLEELRDKVVFPLYGSKLPQRWWDSIQRRINNVRRAVPELRNRILTMKIDNNSTGYFFR